VIIIGAFGGLVGIDIAAGAHTSSIIQTVVPTIASASV